MDKTLGHISRTGSSRLPDRGGNLGFTAAAGLSVGSCEKIGSRRKNAGGNVCSTKSTRRCGLEEQAKGRPFGLHPRLQLTEGFYLPAARAPAGRSWASS